jgi:hypothetical protein
MERACVRRRIRGPRGHLSRQVCGPVASGLEAQQEPGARSRQAGDERRGGGGYLGKGGGREVATCMGEIVQVVPPEE